MLPLPFLFCAILKIWKAKSSSQLGAFFTRWLPIELALKTMLARVVKFFCQDCQNGQRGQNGHNDQNCQSGQNGQRGQNGHNDQNCQSGQNGQKGQKSKKTKNAKCAKIVEIAKISQIAEIAEIAKIVETEIVRFLETFKFRVFFGKIDKLFEKSLSFI